MTNPQIQNYTHECIDDLKIQYQDVNGRSLRILQWNIRGMNVLEKFDSILYFLNDCKTTIDVIVIGETWIKADSTSIYQIPGYHSIFSCRESSHGGLALYINNKINHNVKRNQFSDGLHPIYVELTVDGNCFDVIGRSIGLLPLIFTDIMMFWKSGCIILKKIYLAIL